MTILDLTSSSSILLPMINFGDLLFFKKSIEMLLFGEDFKLTLFEEVNLFEKWPKESYDLDLEFY